MTDEIKNITIPLTLWFAKPELAIPEYYIFKKLTEEEYDKVYRSWIDEFIPESLNLDEIEFIDKLSNTLCTDWYKDYDNEYWKNDRDTAWELTEAHVKEEFLRIRKDVPDDIIFYSIKIGCWQREDNLEFVEQLCRDILEQELIKDRACRLIQHKAKHWLYSAPNGPMFKKSIKLLVEDGVFK
jgi:hypothetical protein